MISLCDNQIAILNACLGVGDIRQSNIVFFGKEPGAAGHNKKKITLEGKTKKEIDAICGYVKSGAYYCVNGRQNDWQKGFTKKIAHDEHFCGIIQRYQSRMMLYLSRNLEISQQTSDEINEYRKDQLYKEKNGLKSCNLDFKPLVRPNEGAKWFYENICRKTYARVFQNLPGLDGHKQTLGQGNDKEQCIFAKRFAMLKQAFNSAKRLQVVISMGDCNGNRKKLFAGLFNIAEQDFMKKEDFYYYARTGNKINIFLTPFFGNGQMSLKQLSCIAQHVSCVIKNKEV